MARMKRIGVLTSGGDASGMNAAIRSVVRTAIHAGSEVFGVRHGYRGLVSGDFIPLGVRDVSGVIHRGGTILGTARCPEFQFPTTRAGAIEQLVAQGIEGLVVIGGNGSQTGAWELARSGFPVVGVASTIDNDLVGTDITIGVDTALAVAVEAIDRIRVTATSHERAFLVEVMGRQCGYLALMAGIAGGAEVVVVPEAETDPEEVARELSDCYDRGKGHAIVVVAEGSNFNATRLAEYFREHEERLGFELRVTILGHSQRGGTPSPFDRLLGTRLGAAAVDGLLAGRHGVLAGWINGNVAMTPLDEVVGRTRGIDLELLKMVRILAR